MFAVFHIPLIDVRPFVDTVPTQRVGLPRWPIIVLPDEPWRRPFVRGFGVTRERWQGGVDEWPGEDHFCDLEGALRFEGAVRAGLPPQRVGLKRYVAFRRLFWDGQFTQQGSVVGRAEIGFGLALKPGSAPFSSQEMASAVDGLLQQPVRIEPGAHKLKLGEAGSALAASYLQASSELALQAALQPWWLAPGAPLLIVEGRRGSEVEAWPAPARPLAEIELLTKARIRVFYGRRRIAGRDRLVCFFETDEQGFHDRDVLRRLRLNVTRLHAALAALRQLADLQAQGRLAPQTAAAKKRLADCLSTYTPFLYQRKQQGLALPPFVAAALAMSEALTPAMFASLRQLVPMAGRGLADQLDRAAELLPTLQPQPLPAADWDIFIAHAGADLPAAEALFEAIGTRAKVFLDQKGLALGDRWDVKLADAQRRSRMTVVLVGKEPEKAYYLCAEIAEAISLARIDATRHRVVPVYLLDEPGAGIRAKPYGLNLLHGIDRDPAMPWATVAERLLTALKAS